MDALAIQARPNESPFAVSLKRDVQLPDSTTLHRFSKALFYPSRMLGRNPDGPIPINPVKQRPGSIDRNDVIAQPVVYVPADALEIGVYFQRIFFTGIKEFDDMKLSHPGAKLYMYFPHFGETRWRKREVFADFYPHGPPQKLRVRKNAGGRGHGERQQAEY